MRIDLRDVLGGLALVAFGAFFALKGQGYSFGTTRSMGPGYFPVVLGWITIGIGGWIAAGGLLRGYQPVRFDLRPLLAVLAGIAGFGLALRHLGLVPAVAAAILLAASGDRTAQPLATFLLAVVMAGASWLLFTRGLGLPMPAFRNPF